MPLLHETTGKSKIDRGVRKGILFGLNYFFHHYLCATEQTNVRAAQDKHYIHRLPLELNLELYGDETIKQDAYTSHPSAQLS